MKSLMVSSHLNILRDSMYQVLLYQVISMYKKISTLNLDRAQPPTNIDKYFDNPFEAILTKVAMLTQQQRKGTN